jgi:hypothetical protein
MANLSSPMSLQQKVHSGDGHECGITYSAFRAFKPITQSHLTVHNEKIRDFTPRIFLGCSLQGWRLVLDV